MLFDGWLFVVLPCGSFACRCTAYRKVSVAVLLLGGVCGSLFFRVFFGSFLGVAFAVCIGEICLPSGK